MSKYISVGKILNFHGVQGEAKVGFTKNQQDFFLNLKEVFIEINNEYKSFCIEKSRVSKGVAIVKFVGINNINELLPLKGCILFVDENTIRENLDENEFLIDELVGLKILDEEENNLGIVIGVSNNGASDLLSVKTKSQKISLIPFVKAIIKEVSIEKKYIKIDNIEGLLE